MLFYELLNLGFFSGGVGGGGGFGGGSIFCFLLFQLVSLHC